MELISGKDLCGLIYETLETLDKRPIVHGERTSYILYKMLQNQMGFEAYQFADMDYIATLHDIGAYRTDDLNDALKYEAKEYLPHSVYGYLFFKYLSPYEEQSKIILYHHSELNQTKNIQYKYKDIAMYLHVAEATEIYKKALGTKFSIDMFSKYMDIKYSRKSLDLLYSAQSRYNILGALEDDSYKLELEKVRKYQVFSKEDHKKLLNFLIFCIGFRNKSTCEDITTCVRICKELSKKLTLPEEDATILYYAAIVHDLGMILIPSEIIEAPRKLTQEEMEKMREHVKCTGQMLEGKFPKSVIDVALSHHERFDGSGYPLGLKASNMTMPMAILQVADTVSALIGERSFRPKRTSVEVCKILKEDAKRGKYHSLVVETMIEHFDEIVNAATADCLEHRKIFEKISNQYEMSCGGIEA